MRQPIDQLKIDLRKMMQETASQMSNTARKMFIFANRTDADAEQIRDKANKLNGAARILLNWYDAMFPKATSEPEDE